MIRDIDYQISVMKAFKEGKEIECKLNSGEDDWGVTILPSWNWDKYDYRIKEEPKYVPYENTEELIEAWQKKTHDIPSNLKDLVMPLIWVSYKYMVQHSLITKIIPPVTICFSNEKISLEELFENYTYLDGSPCGKKVE